MINNIFLITKGLSCFMFLSLFSSLLEQKQVTSRIKFIEMFTGNMDIVAFPPLVSCTKGGSSIIYFNLIPAQTCLWGILSLVDTKYQPIGEGYYCRFGLDINLKIYFWHYPFAKTYNFCSKAPKCSLQIYKRGVSKLYL